MRLSHGIAAIVLARAGVTANAAELSATVTATTDYDFRGITQTAQDPAIQGSIDLATDPGFYAGVWASNVDFGPGDCFVVPAGFRGVWEVLEPARKFYAIYEPPGG